MLLWQKHLPKRYNYFQLVLFLCDEKIFFSILSETYLLLVYTTFLSILSLSQDWFYLIVEALKSTLGEKVFLRFIYYLVTSTQFMRNGKAIFVDCSYVDKTVVGVIEFLNAWITNKCIYTMKYKAPQPQNNFALVVFVFPCLRRNTTQIDCSKLV